MTGFMVWSRSNCSSSTKGDRNRKPPQKNSHNSKARRIIHGSALPFRSDSIPFIHSLASSISSRRGFFHRSLIVRSRPSTPLRRPLLVLDCRGAEIRPDFTNFFACRFCS